MTEHSRTNNARTRPAEGSELPARLMAKLRIEIEGYELLERLGQGGQATVYRGIQKQDGRMVAIKVLHAGPHATDEARGRLKREINALRAIRHPNIVQAIAAGRTRSGLDCLVMNYIEGRPLDALWTDPAFASGIASQPADLLRLFMQICLTVQEAHRLGITHRDLSPSNIILDAAGRPHILDFGMASTAFDGIVTKDISVTGQFIGKLRYASPEQAKAAGSSDNRVDIRSDVYALGILLYQILTGGAFPYEVVGNIIDVLHNIIHSKPRAPSTMVEQPGPSRGHLETQPVRRNPPLVNATIEAIVLKALEKDPQNRYQSAGELAADIQRYLAGQPTSAAWPAQPEPVSRPFVTRRSAVAAAAIVLAVTFTGVAMNAKALAVWLGIVAAPVLPLQISPIAPDTAHAATLESEQPDGTDRRLNDLAADLAKIDARLRAVHKQLAATSSRKPPELDEREPGGSGPYPAEELVAWLTKISGETGRSLAFDALAQGDIDRAEQAEAAAIERETDEASLLARRAELDAQQSDLWARLAWGTFTGREVDRLFKFRLVTDPMGDANGIAKGRVLDAGVKVRRAAGAALDQAATTLRVPASGDEGSDTGLAAASVQLAEQLRVDLMTFQKAAGAARDAGSLTPEEAGAVAELQKHAERLRDAIDGTAEMQDKAAGANDEIERFTARGRLQRDLRDTADAAARLDAGLVKLAGEWTAQVDVSSPLPEVKLAVVQRPQTPARQQSRHVLDQAPLTLATIMPVESIWNVRWTTSNQPNKDFSHNASVQSNNGTDAVMRWNNGLNTWLLTFQLVEGQLKLVSCEQADGGNPGLFREAAINGDIDNFRNTNRVLLTGTIQFRNRYPAPASSEIDWQFDLRRMNQGRGDAGANAANQLNKGDSLTGQLAINGKVFTATATIQNMSKQTAVVRVDNGNGVWDYTLSIKNETIIVKSMNRVRTNTGNLISNWDLSGIITADKIELSGYWTLKQPNGTVTRDSVQLNLAK